MDAQFIHTENHGTENTNDVMQKVDKLVTWGRLLLGAIIGATIWVTLTSSRITALELQFIEFKTDQKDVQKALDSLSGDVIEIKTMQKTVVELLQKNGK